MGIVDKIVVTKQSGKINFGIQLVAKESLPVTYRQLNAPNNKTSQKGLAYTIKEENIEKTHLIVDNFMLKDGDAILLFMKNKRFPMALGNRKNIGLGYWQFECSPTVEMEKPLPAKKRLRFH
ncbi:conserved hypothetical protein [Candidatus Methylobacter favarea]|uniref:Uncharacterized protein n=1 Tax=Candidatus Methylobacter favarea TaxID=2707345 RepID=A0A8S0XFZ0_9GAMM|nr:hypothetical protein [Candidatus Methylobacter favarea]CAA9890707.1 conserved hypothetical protein [Candidatus Methylobacter favarea]